LLWKRVSETVTEILDSVTLQDLSVQADILLAESG
jgi:DNA-binding IscR family transcriptional regulator